MEADMKNKKSSLIPLIALVLFIALAQSGCTLDVLAQQLEETTVQTPNDEGELENDYAIKYTVRVRSKGVDGKVRVMAKLYTPEGQFYREQIATMKPDEAETFEFIFTEPTVEGTMFSDRKVHAEFSYETVK
jgi:hypothetical protein